MIHFYHLYLLGPFPLLEHTKHKSSQKLFPSAGNPFLSLDLHVDKIKKNQ